MSTPQRSFNEANASLLKINRRNLPLLILCGCILWSFRIVSHAAVYERQEDSDFLKSILNALPARSALPPLSPIQDAKKPYVDVAWEEKYKNMLGTTHRDITDLSAEDLLAPASLGMTTKEQVGGSTLPARSASLVVVGTVGRRESHISRDRHLIYCDYEILPALYLKDDATQPKGERLTTISVLSFGGAIRFPNSHTAYFIVYGAGYLAEGKRYLLFLGKTVKTIQKSQYDVFAAYLLEDQKVYPILTVRPGAYDGYDQSRFLAMLKSAIEENVDR